MPNSDSSHKPPPPASAESHSNEVLGMFPQASCVDNEERDQAQGVSVEDEEDDIPLNESEFYWRDHYDWLLGKGYQLRSRYSPDWVPSWKLDDTKEPRLAEDSQIFRYYNVNDATRVSDGKHVALKRILRSEYPEEVSILRYFSEENLVSQPENHTVPLLEVLNPPDDPEHDIVVFPVLREYDDPDFDTVGEAVDFIRQLLEGFTFLHEHRVAHRDVKVENVMMDPEALQFPKFHFCRPWRYHGDKYEENSKIAPKFRRTERRPKYYIIDFGYSSQYSEQEMPPREPPMGASDRSLPELKDRGRLYSPFPIDVYCVGNMLRRDFLDGFGELNKSRAGRYNFEFLRPLVEDMTKEDPEERITMKDALEIFDSIVATLPSATLRSRVIPKPGEWVLPETPIQMATRTTAHWLRRFKYIAKRLPAIPSSTPS